MFRNLQPDDPGANIESTPPLSTPDNVAEAGHSHQIAVPAFTLFHNCFLNTFCNMAIAAPNGTWPSAAHHKLLDAVVRTPGRQPSPQPTLLGVPGTSHSNNSRVLHEEGPGYVAPKFEGKEHQMEQGEHAI
jgi:hypothetical protein